jgi:hypothetical protein
MLGHLLKFTQCISSQARVGPMYSVCKSKTENPVVKTENLRQKKVGRAGDEHTNFCSNVSLLQLVH